MTLKKIRNIVIFLVLIVVLVGVGFLSLLTVFEYRPDDIERVNAMGKPTKGLKSGEEITLLTWNLGYLALGEKSDFFMDGGKMVRGISKEDVDANMKAVIEELKKSQADVIFLQEVDKKAHRSYGVKQVEGITEELEPFVSSFANNFKALFVPFPFPPLRDVDAGVFSLTKYEVEAAHRIALPNPFKWPVRTVNLKRCLLVNRVKVEGTDKEAVLVNLHLEAYDDGEGKIAQTKAMMDFMEEEYKKGNYVIAGGDFNQSFSTVDLSKFPLVGEKVWKPGHMDVSPHSEDFSFLMDSTVPSCRSLEKPYDKTDTSFNHYVIDGYIVSKNVEVLEFETVDLKFKHSDHNPLRLKVRLK